MVGGSSVRENITPKTQEVQVRPDVQRGLKTVRTCSRVAVSVSSTIGNLLNSIRKLNINLLSFV